MKFRVLLWGLGLFMAWAGRYRSAFRKQLEGRSMVFQISSQDGVVRHYRIQDMRVSGHGGSFPCPVFEISFVDAATGFATLTAANSQLAFMQGIQDRRIVINGDVGQLMWFQGLMRHLLAKKKQV